MSFMNNSGADCSANANPLAQFSKHSNDDRSLQQSLINQQQQQEQNGSGMRSVAQMAPAEREAYTQFMNGNRGGASFSNFQPMRHELDRMGVGNNNNSAGWADGFQRGSPRLTHQPEILSPSATGATRMGSSWAGDFQATASGAGVHQQQSRDQFQGQPQRMGSYGAGAMGWRRPVMAMQPQGSMEQQQQQQPDVAQWEDQFSEIERKMQEQAAEQAADGEIVVDDKYKANFDEVWDSLNTDFQNDEQFNAEYEASWEKDFHTYASGRLNYGQYKPARQNQFAGNPDAYAIGVRLMESGARLSEAALAFEAAVQQDDAHVDAWLKLGQVQTQNEKEAMGISALEKCLELDAQNLTALMTLAISYVNEGYDNAAYATLERWIETKYPQISGQARQANPTINDEDRYSLNKRITELFIKAAQLSPTLAKMDADVQTGLGVLFYSMEEFDKTIDCFKAAIQQNPDDSLMWNRLGASLANSNRSEEAIEAYSRALTLNPNFVRARYNLGVSCINMGLYQQAVEHLLAGLSMHDVDGVADNGSGSVSLLETLKRAFLAMDRRDLIEKVRPGMDLKQFKGEFDF